MKGVLILLFILFCYSIASLFISAIMGMTGLMIVALVSVLVSGGLVWHLETRLIEDEDNEL